MTYYCFLCNENHDDSPTEEHFIPRSIDGPQHQWLPVCKASNTRSNSVFDNDARDILYWVRFQNSGTLKRTGEALLGDGTLKRFKFAYDEASVSERSATFGYIYDRETDTRIPSSRVYAFAFPVGLILGERETYCRGLAKMSIGALAYLLKNQGIEDQKIRNVFAQTPVDAVRHFALDLPWSGNTVAMTFSLGRSDVLARLQHSCKYPRTRNHVIIARFQKDHSIHVEGMLYSQYGWSLNLSNEVSVGTHELRLENSIAHMDAPESLRDMTLSPDAICIINPDYTGPHPDIPRHWRTK